MLSDARMETNRVAANWTDEGQAEVLLVLKIT